MRGRGEDGGLGAGSRPAPYPPMPTVIFESTVTVNMVNSKDIFTRRKMKEKWLLQCNNECKDRGIWG